MSGLTDAIIPLWLVDIEIDEIKRLAERHISMSASKLDVIRAIKPSNSWPRGPLTLSDHSQCRRNFISRQSTRP